MLVGEPVQKIAIAVCCAVRTVLLTPPNNLTSSRSLAYSVLVTLCGPGNANWSALLSRKGLMPPQASPRGCMSGAVYCQDQGSRPGVWTGSVASDPSFKLRP